MSGRRKTAAARRTVRARVRGRSLDLLDPIALREGDEVLVSISEPLGPGDELAFRRAGGAWKGLIDADALIANIHADRLISTRPSLRL